MPPFNRWMTLDGSREVFVNGTFAFSNVLNSMVRPALGISADQFSSAVIATGKPPALLAQVFARWHWRSIDGARYIFQFNDESESGVANPRWQLLYEGLPPTANPLLASVPATRIPVAGDVLRIEARGSNPVELRGFHNDIPVISAIDSSPEQIPEGYPGIGMRLRREDNPPASNSPVFESWAGGDLPPLLHIRRESVDTFALSFSRRPGQNNWIETATTLAPPNWTVLTNFWGWPGETNAITIVSNTSPRQFYRLR